MAKTISKNNPKKPNQSRVWPGFVPGKWLSMLLLALFSVLYYANTIRNHYALDDYLVVENNETVAKGLAGIPEIITSLYTSERSNSFGYRPIAQISFAIEQQFTGGSSISPNISHLINVLLYVLAVLLLYQLLLRLLRGYNPWFPLLISLLFLAHPLHTEVVASLKNREILLEFIFSMLALRSLVAWADFQKKSHLFKGMLFYTFALLSKETAIAQLAVFPLVLYFFTPAKPSQIKWVVIAGVLILIPAVLGPRMLLPEMNRNFRLMENPLFVEENFFVRMATALYILGYYLKLLFLPFPLRYYYGFNMIPLTNWADPLVWLSLLIHLGLLYLAVKGFLKKSILSFFILYYLINIAMYANIVSPVPGIVGERFMFFSSLSFAALLAYLIHRISRLPLKTSSGPLFPVIVSSLLMLAVLIPYAYLTVNRNAEWRTHFTLYKADMRKLNQSVKANDLYASELMKQVNAELSKPVNPYKFIVPLIERATNHYKQAINIDSTHWTSYNNLGIISQRIHGAQYLLRAKSLYSKGDTLKARQEYDGGVQETYKAIGYFKRALRLKPNYDAALFNIGMSFDQLNLPDSSVGYYRRSLEISPTVINARSRLANALFSQGNMEEAVRENLKIVELDPQSDLPYINLGNYYYVTGDQDRAIGYYLNAFERNPKPEIARVLSSYYQDTGDTEKAAFYMQAAQNPAQPGQK
jgi:tetratricopeptide (TPR) repeat protein